MTTAKPFPRRGEIWTADLGEPARRHWVLVVSLDARNQSENVDSILTVPFGSFGVEGPTALRLEPGETGLPDPSYVKGHFITTVKKVHLKERIRTLSASRMREITLLIRRAFDPDAPAWYPPGA